MIKRLCFLFFSLGLCIACNKVEKPEKPQNLISKGKMKDILFDVFVFNAAKVTDRRLLEKNHVSPDVYIYEKHGIDSLQFVKSNEYYAYNIKVYEDMISEVEARIRAEKVKYQEQIDLEEERRKQRIDSIRKLGDSLKPKKIKNQERVKKASQN